MNYLRILGFLGLILLFAQCDSEPQNTETIENLSKSNVAQKHEQIISLDSRASQKIDHWQEYRSLHKFLNQYQSISPNEALNNSKELNDLVRSLKDSIKPDFLESPAFKARINLLHNETLRLFDMSFITSIKNEEVNQQVEKVLESFSAMNLKINTILKQKELDRLVDDPKFNRSIKEKDTTPIPKNVDNKKAFGKSQKIQPKKETAKERKMRLSKEQRLIRRQQKLQSIQKQQDDKKKKKN
jgi:hypothetical protein